MQGIYQHIFYQPEITALFSDRQLLDYMLQVEVALAKAQAQLGVIPEAAATVIAAVVAQQGVSCLDQAQLATAAGLAGNLAIPLVKQLTHAVAQQDQSAAGYVHWGATSQDVIDSACMLQIRAALQLIEQSLQQAYLAAIELTQQYRHQVMIGRTWLQHALPISFGFKSARWASALKRDLERLQQLKSRVLCAQLGGATGSLASLGDQGGAVLTAFAAQLDLHVPDCSWHAERDRMAEVASMLAVMVGNLGKMARDWSLLMQTEIAELSEPVMSGRGGSSTMPHKRNPVAAASVLAAANRVPSLMASLYQSMLQEHERGLGGWHAEWLIMPEIFQLSMGALAHTVEVLQGLEIHPEQMQHNIEATQGLVMAEALMMLLAEPMGRLNAHHCIQAACQRAVAEQRHLLDVVLELPELRAHCSAEQIAACFLPSAYLGNIQQQIDSVLAQAVVWQASIAKE